MLGEVREEWGAQPGGCRIVDPAANTVGSTVGYCRLYCRFRTADSDMRGREVRQIVRSINDLDGFLSGLRFD